MKLKGLILGDIRQQYKYGFLCPIYVIYTSVYYSIAHSSYAVERTMYNYPYIFRSRTDRINVYGSNNIIREKRKSNAGISCFAHIDTRIHFVKGNFHWTNFFAKWSSHRIVLRHGTFLHTSCCWNYVRFSIIHTGWNITFCFYFNHE